MFKKIFLTTILTITSYSFLLDADEFWLQPSRFQFHPGESVQIKFLTGDSFLGQNWDGTRQNVSSLHLYYNDIEDSLESYIPDSTSGDSLSLQFYDPGTAMVCFLSAPFLTSFHSAIPAHEGIEMMPLPLNDTSQSVDTLAGTAPELVYQSVKTILQVGARRHEICTHATGLPLEFIPLTHPYDLSQGDSLQVKALFQGNPLAQYQVKVWHMAKGRNEIRSYTTNANGIFSFPVSLNGNWMVSTKVIEKLPRAPEQKERKAEWQSWSGNLTWGYTH